MNQSNTASFRKACCGVGVVVEMRRRRERWTLANTNVIVTSDSSVADHFTFQHVMSPWIWKLSCTSTAVFSSLLLNLTTSSSEIVVKTTVTKCIIFQKC